MAVNAYERPAEQRFMDTYAPLPFQEIMAVGQAYQRERERTEQDIEQFMAEHSKFTSPSAIDAANYEALTKGVLDPQFQRMRMDPEWLRSQEGQAAIRGAIRSVDTGKLGMLRQSSEFLQERARNRAKLIAAGKYKESWDELADLSQYDTLSRGVLSDLSPMEYTSLHDIATPYAENLEPSFLGRFNRYYDLVGVDETAIRGSINSQFDSILSTPQGQKWYKDIAAEMIPRGMTDANEIKEEMLNRLVQTQKDRIRVRKELDSARLQMDLVSEKANAKKPGSQTDISNTPRYTDMLQTAANSFMSTYVKYLGQDPIRKEYKEEGADLAATLQEARASGNREQIEEAESAIANFNFKVARDNIRTTFYSGAGLQELPSDRPGTKVPISEKNKVDGIYNVLNTYSIPNHRDGAEAIIGVNASEKTKDGFIYKSTSSFVTPREAVTGAGELGIKMKPSLLDRVLEEGAFKNVKVVPAEGNNIYTSMDKRGNVTPYQRVIITVDEENIDKKALGRAMDKFQFQPKKAPSNPYETVAQSMPSTWVDSVISKMVKTNRGFVRELEPEESDRVSVNAEGEMSVGTTTKGKPRKIYSVEVLMPVKEMLGNPLVISKINQDVLRTERTKKDAGEMYSSEVEASYAPYLQDAEEQYAIESMQK